MNASRVGPVAAWILVMIACAPLGAAAAPFEAVPFGETLLLRRQPAPAPPSKAPALRRMRPNTISLGAQLSFGAVRGSSELNDHFDQGLGYAFRFRYSLSPRVALGISFENQGYDSRAVPFPQPPLPADSQLVVTTVSAEGVVFFQREKAWTPYLLGGLGFASPNVNYEESGSRRVNEGPFATIGAGVEKFVRPRVSLDFSLRGYAQLGNSELSLFSQVSGGIHLYPGD